jgi:hypothetical protein
VTDGNWLAVHDRVRQGLEDFGVLENPPTSEIEVGYLAETITDHVVAAVELSVEQRREAKQRRRDRTRRWLGSNGEERSSH